MQELSEEILGTHREGMELPADDIRGICLRSGIIPPGFRVGDIQNDTYGNNLDKVANRKIGKILKKASLVSETIELENCSCVIRKSETATDKGKYPLVLIIG